MVLIDTSAWVEFFRPTGRLEVKIAVGHLRANFMGALCGPVEMEFLGGLPRPQWIRHRRDFALLPYLRNDSRLWQEAADHYAKLREHAITAPWNDVLIATIALKANCRLYAVDHHFKLMAPVLGIRLYEPGYNGSFRPETES